MAGRGCCCLFPAIKGVVTAGILDTLAVVFWSVSGIWISEWINIYSLWTTANWICFFPFLGIFCLKNKVHYRLILFIANFIGTGMQVALCIYGMFRCTVYQKEHPDEKIDGYKAQVSSQLASTVIFGGFLLDAMWNWYIELK